MSFPLQIAKICIDCETVFAGGGDYCIACGSKSWVWLSRYFYPKEMAKERIKHEKIIDTFVCTNIGDRS